MNHSGYRWLARTVLVVLPFMLVGAPGMQASAQSPTGDGSAREEPVAVGESLDIASYDVRVTNVNLDAADVVLAENQFNAPPEPGNVFVLVTGELTYTGPDTGTPWVDLDFKAVGSENRGYSQSDADCGVIPNELFDVPELFTDGTADFGVCWQVSSDEAPTLVMYVEELFSLDGDRYWFSLDMATATNGTPGAAATETPTPQAEGDEDTAVEAEATVELSAVDIAYAPTELTIPADTDVDIVFTNNGVLQHSFVVEETDIASDLLDGGDSTTLTVNLPAGTYEFYCNVPGHREAGMTGVLIVE